MQYIRAMSMQKKILEKNRISMDNLLDSCVHVTEKTKIKSEEEEKKLNYEQNKTETYSMCKVRLEKKK